MKFDQALSEATQNETKGLLTEGFRRYNFAYRGSRPWYKIHDKKPFVLAIDDNYNVDKRGKSILGINMHYFDDENRRTIFRRINKLDDEAGFKGFDARSVIERDKAPKKRAYDNKIKDKRIERYELFKKNFPQLLPHLRRYKYSAIDNIKRRKDDDHSDLWRELIRQGHEGD